MIDPHVIHLVDRPSEGFIDLIAIVGAAHGEVEQQEEFLPEDLGIGRRRSQGRYVHAVHAEDEGIAVPDDGVGVEFGGRVAHRGAVGGLDRVASVAGGGVEGVADGIGLAEGSAPFHHVNLAALRPANRRDVGAQHPSGRPGADARRQFRAELELAVFEAAFVLRLDAGRGPGGILVVLFDRLDDQVAVFHPQILGAVRVVLRLAVAPAVLAGADLGCPVGRVE